MGRLMLTRLLGGLVGLLDDLKASREIPKLSPILCTTYATAPGVSLVHKGLSEHDVCNQMDQKHPTTIKSNVFGSIQQHQHQTKHLLFRSTT